MKRFAVAVVATFVSTAAAAPPPVGRLLVATGASNDPDFARTVVIVVHSDTHGVVGLMLNRPTDVPVARLFSAASRKEETAYAGGPLALGINGLSKSKSRPRGAIAITGGLWLLPDKEAIEVALASGNPVRVYVGQCGWSTRQIETEIARGLWVVSPGDADLVFDPAPDTLWKRLSARSRH